MTEDERIAGLIANCELIYELYMDGRQPEELVGWQIDAHNELNAALRKALKLNREQSDEDLKAAKIGFVRALRSTIH